MNIIQALDDAEGQRKIAIIGSLSANTSREEGRHETLLATLNAPSDSDDNHTSTTDEQATPSDTAMTAR